jgi:3'(2'), 5'-bisphosphate nucleotidase
VLEKKDKGPVTVADFGSQALVCRIIGDAFPGDPIIGEEDSAELRQANNGPLLDRLGTHVRSVVPDATDEQILEWIDRGGQTEYAPRYWTLDPIDGTKGFLRKDQYAISLALVVNGEIVLGVVCCPNLPLKEGGSQLGIVQVAEKGEGAFQCALDGDTPFVPIHASTQAELAQVRTCESVEKAHSSHSDSARIAAALGITAEPVRIDSQAKYATVARGSAEAYLRLPRDGSYREKIWDHAGGVIVVQEAGGKVTDIRGNNLNFAKGSRLEENIGVIVTNGIHHDAIIQAIANLKIGQF